MVAFGVGVRKGARFSEPGTPQPWSPQSISGLAGWFDMQDSVYGYTLLSNLVVNILNKASGIWWTPLSRAAAPVYSLTGLNGMPCMQMDGVATSIISADPAVLASQQAGVSCTVIGAVRTNFTGNAALNLSWFGVGVGTGTWYRNIRWYGTGLGAGGTWCTGKITSTGVQQQIESSAANDTLPHVLAWVYDGVTMSQSKDGGAGDPSTTFTTTAVTPTQCAIGSIPTNPNANYWTGQIGEVLIYNRNLSQAELDQVTAWMMVKWGYTPDDIPGLVGWFDCQDGNNFAGTPGSFMTSITNKATGVVYSTAMSVMPGYATGLLAFGSPRPSMSFNGATQGVACADGADTVLMNAMAGTGKSYHLFGAVRTTAPNSDSGFFALGNSGSASFNDSIGFGCVSTGAGFWSSSMASSSGVVTSITSAANDFTGDVVWEYFRDGTNGSMRINGGPADPSGASQNIASFNPNRVALGVFPRATPVGRWTGFVGEVIVYSRQLASGEAAFVRAYMANKWAIFGMQA